MTVKRSHARQPSLDPHALLLRDAAERAGLETRTVMVASPRSGVRRPHLRFSVAGVQYDFRFGVLRRVLEENPDLPGRHVNGRAAVVTTSKSDTKAILLAAGLSVPVGRVFDGDSLEEALTYAASLSGPVCVKPNHGKKGMLVFPDRSDATAIAEAFRAVAASYPEILVEQSVLGEELRFFYVEPRAVAVKMSVKPSILGDGRQTVLELIEQKNRDEASTRLADQEPVVADRELVAILAEQGFGVVDVPETGRRIFLDRTANGTRGGGHIECRDSVDQSYWRRVEDAFKAVPGLVLGALDMIVLDRTRPAAPGNYWILEINSSPSLLPYHRPWQGRPQNVSGAIIDYLQRLGAPYPAMSDEEDQLDQSHATPEERLRLQETIQSALERLERASPIEVAETQLAALERIIRHAHDATAFYADRLAPLFVDGEFAPQHWAAVPILTREEAQDSAAAIRSAYLPEGTSAHDGETSGSSGTPLKFAWSTLSTISTRAVVERMAVWHGLDPAAPLAEIRSFPNGHASFPGRRVQRSWSFRNSATPYYRLSVTTPVAQQLAWLKLVEARYLLTYPTMARELAQACLAQDIGLRFDAVLTVGEVLTSEIRELCRTAFGARTIDSYGCQEMGKIAIQCEVSGHYHVCASNVLMEILDEDGRQVSPGQSGRIVLTSLYNYATPFIRYEIGDFGRLGGPCPCGRSLPVLTEILGRRRNIITLPDGNRLWLPGRALAAMAAHVPMKRIRLVQTAPDEFDLLYLPKADGGEPDLTRLQACAAHHIHPQVRIRAIPVDDLARSSGGKYEDVVGLG